MQEKPPEETEGRVPKGLSMDSEELRACKQNTLILFRVIEKTSILLYLRFSLYLFICLFVLGATTHNCAEVPRNNFEGSVLSF